MSYVSTQQHGDVSSGQVAFVSWPGPRALDAMIAVAAEMALADGNADAVEQRSLLNFMKHRKILISFGRSETTKRFASEVRRATAQASTASGYRDQPGRWQALTDRLRPLAGMHAATMIATLAVEVAMADGVVHPDELELLRALESALALEPFTLDEQA